MNRWLRRLRAWGLTYLRVELLSWSWGGPVGAALFGFSASTMTWALLYRPTVLAESGYGATFVAGLWVATGLCAALSVVARILYRRISWPTRRDLW